MLSMQNVLAIHTCMCRQTYQKIVGRFFYLKFENPYCMHTSYTTTYIALQLVPTSRLLRTFPNSPTSTMPCGPRTSYSVPRNRCHSCPLSSCALVGTRCPLWGWLYYSNVPVQGLACCEFGAKKMLSKSQSRYGIPLRYFETKFLHADGNDEM